MNSSFVDTAAAAAKSLQSCPTLCDPIDDSPPGSSVPGIARKEYWSGLPFPSPMHACMHAKSLQLCATPWTAAHQAPLSTEFSRQEHWSGLPFPSPFVDTRNIYMPISALILISQVIAKYMAYSLLLWF